MNTGSEKVCRRCGALNDERSLVCVRCGEMLEISEEKKYEVFKDKMLSEKWFLFLFTILFLIYSFGAIFYIGPWLYNRLICLGEKYIFNLFEKLDLIFLSLEVLYTLFLSVVNYIAIAIILYSAISSKVMKRDKLNRTCIATYIFMILCFIIMTIYKHKFNYVIIIEHFMSIIIAFPYIKRIILKRSI